MITNYVFICYLLVIIGIGYWASKKAKTNEEFVFGGRKIPGFALALSERAAGESSWLFLGLTGLAFIEGWGAIWVALGCVIGILFIWWVMADRLRKMSIHSGATTIPGLFAARFQGKAKVIQIFSSLIIIFFFLFYIAAQFDGTGKILLLTFGIDEFTGGIIAATIIILYTLMGGFMSVVYIDVFQALLMIIIIIVVPALTVSFLLMQQNVDITEILQQMGPAYNVVHGAKGTTAFLYVLSGLSWALGYTGQPHLLARMMAISDRHNVNIARSVASIWTLMAYIGAIILGIAGIVMVNKAFFTPSDILILSNDNEKILPVMIAFFATPFFIGILLSGIVSAMMSTAASQLMVCTFGITEDIISKERLDERKKIWLNRTIILMIGIVAFIIGNMGGDSVYNLVSYAWSGIGSSFGPALLLLLFWKRFSFAGLMASLMGGTLGTLVWKNFFLASTGVSERLVSFIFALILAFVFSLVLPDKKPVVEVD